MNGTEIVRCYIIWIFIITIFPLSANGQYFGRNKVQYKSLDFSVLQTPNFEIYHYIDDDSLLNHLAARCEQWYHLHQQSLKDTIQFKNPIIFYRNHGDFQQTTAISSLIGVGTGGVTESLKNRVVMPLLMSARQTDHVLGHELVHAFQYNMLIRDDSATASSIRNIPLWMIEGLAEYLSIGRIDAHTAMWMRDAVINDDIPTLKELTFRPGAYFPYRYGQAFWAFLTGVWGDSVITPMLKRTAKLGLDNALISMFSLNADTMSAIWQESLMNIYKPFQSENNAPIAGTRIISEENAGTINISPAISPDGKYLMFLSERDVLNIDLFLADAGTGKILKKISSATRASHIDALDFIESAGAWSPDGNQFAYVVYSQGVNKLVILDVFKNKIVNQIKLSGLPSFSNPSWSPDGNSIVVTGLVQGQSDLYRYDLKQKSVQKLTDDYYSDIQPSWSPDGNFIVFASDRLSHRFGKTNGKYTFNLSYLDMSTGQVIDLDLFYGANNLNPVFSPDSRSIYFLSDRDGFRNLYRYDLKNQHIYQTTNYFTGISGITTFSPAISLAMKNECIAYTHYFKKGYTIYRAPLKDFHEKKVNPESINFLAATLPPVQPSPANLVDEHLSKIDTLYPVPVDSFKVFPYRPKFKLDYISNLGIGISTSRYGTGIAGGVNMLFSDMIGNNQLLTGLALNGMIYDFAGMAAYLNQKNRINWGVAISHIPFRSSRLGLKADTIQYNDTTLVVDNLYLDELRTFEDQINVFTFLPLSLTNRFELGSTFSRYSYRLDRINNYYLDDILIGESRDEKLPAPSGFSVWSGSLAFVKDNSKFGIASPLQGNRIRLEVSKFLGDLDFHTFLVDFRKYQYVKPLSLAFRAYHFARHGHHAENDRLSELFIGFPTLIRGYDNVIFTNRLNGDIDNGFTVNDLFGSRILVGNFEVRLPLSGPKRLTLFESSMLFTEVTWFFDAGVAWNSGRKLFSSSSGTDTPEATPVYSMGWSQRINLFGQMVLEHYYAIPFQREDIKTGTFGLNFWPGW